MRFLFTGATPLQRDVDVNRLPCTTLAAIHGRVRSAGGSPTPGVAVSVVGKPEFGSTVTRADGAFDLAVTAGEHVVQLSTPVFLPVHRRVVATRARLTTLEDDVVLVPTDEKATTVELPAGGLHTATVRQDGSGRRQLRLFIPAGTTAVAELRDGGTQALPRVTVRVTEYTVGSSGPNAMPAQLPESSAYTFAAEFTVDEAAALGATGVRFSGPVATWVENFLGSPLCTQVPQGRYDARLMRWVSEPASLVVATAPGGLDVTGDGVADSEGRLLPGEAEALASTFPAGTSLVRTLSTHFSPRDDNYPWRCEGTCQGSTRKVPDKCPRGCTQRGSIIDCHNQTVSEAWAVPGTGLSLELHSHRQPAGSFRLEVPLGTDVDGGVRGALAGRIVLDIAGQRLVAEVPDAGEGTTLRVNWNGKDALGRVVRGPVEGTLQAGFRFGRQNVSGAPAGGTCTGDLLRFGATASSFGNVPVDGAAATGPGRDSRFFSNSQPVLLGTWVGAEDLGGFSLGILHGSSASTGTLFMGNGLFMREAEFGATARLYAGAGRTRMDSLPARDAQLNQVAHLVAGPDGSLYFVDNGTTIRRVTADGARVETVAGMVGAGAGFSGDGASARAARFSAIDGLAVALNGDVFIADTGNQRIRRVEASTGVVTTVAGTGATGVPSTGATALQAPLNTPRTMAWGADNKLYFFTYTGTGSGDLLFRLSDGALERVGGGAAPIPPPPTESDSAHRVGFSTFGKRMAQGPDGSLYITDNRARVRRLTPSGRIELVAGEGRQTQDGDRGVVTQFGDAMGVAVDALGLVYVADRGGAPGRRGGSIRAVGSDGKVTTVVGTGELPSGRAPDLDKPGTAINLGESREVAVLPDGRLVYAEGFFGTIQVLQRAWDLSLGERGVGSEDGNEVYVFDASGRHLRTLETLTGTPIWRFSWDASGRLASVTDRNGDVTTVLRDAQGRFSGLRAADGQLTQATLDTEGRVTALTDAANRTVRVTWNSRGQPASWEDEERGLTRFGYDDDGRLVSETDANGGVKTVDRDETKSGYTVSYRSPEGRLTRYEVNESGRFRLYTNTFPNGLQTVSRASGGRETTFFPDGTVVDEFLASDTRFGSQSPYRATTQTRMPSGLTVNVGATRTVTLDGGAVLALARLEETTSLNTNTWTRVYTANDRTWRMTSPVGRVTTVRLDEKGRPLTWTPPGVFPTQVTYDTRGRPFRVTQGARRLDVTYGANGFADTLTDALGRTTLLASDATGQLNTATRPDMEVYGFGWDAKGNLTSLTPPGKPAHGFSYSKLNEVTGYTPPMVAGVGNEAYRWTRDSEVESVTHPDGTTSTVTRDSAGRTTRIASPWATATLDYSSMTGQPTFSTRDGQRLDWRYDGALMVAEASSGVVPGTVSYRHDSFFRVTSVAVNDAGVAYTYDNDGLLVSAGPVTLARSVSTGQLHTATTGIVSTAYTFDGYGAPASLETRVSGASVFREVLTWDDIGRVTAKDVTVQGVTTRWAYSYDSASRLAQARRDGVVVGTWTYDGNGNRLTADTVASTFDAQDRQLTAGATTFVHDAFGNRTRKTEGTQVTQSSTTALVASSPPRCLTAHASNTSSTPAGAVSASVATALWRRAGSMTGSCGSSPRRTVRAPSSAASSTAPSVNHQMSWCAAGSSTATSTMRWGASGSSSTPQAVRWTSGSTTTHGVSSPLTPARAFSPSPLLAGCSTEIPASPGSARATMTPRLAGGPRRTRLASSGDQITIRIARGRQ